MKTCGTCKKVYSKAEWDALPVLGKPKLHPSEDGLNGFVMIMKNCQCKSTLALLESLFVVQLNLMLDDGPKVAELHEVATETEAHELTLKLMLDAKYLHLGDERIGALIYKLPLPDFAD